MRKGWNTDKLGPLNQKGALPTKDNCKLLVDEDIFWLFGLAWNIEVKSFLNKQ